MRGRHAPCERRPARPAWSDDTAVPRHAWPALLRLLDAALGVKPAARAAWLAQLEGADAALRPALRRLLDERLHLERSAFLERAAPQQEDGACRAGDRVGPWVLRRELGTGGMARVWLADAEAAAAGARQRSVALKMPRTAAPALAELLQREAALHARLSHPGIAACIAAGHDGARPWLALEPLAGMPITAYAQAHGLGVDDRLRLFLDLLRTVEHLHRQRVIHCDLKPAHALVDALGRVRLIDFGVAQWHGAEHARDLACGRALTLAYAAPEQLAGAALAPSADVYALGVLLYELLAGVRPYALAKPCPAALGSVLAALRRPSCVAAGAALRRELQGEVDAAVMRALQAEPARRQASAGELAHHLGRWLARRERQLTHSAKSLASSAAAAVGASRIASSCSSPCTSAVESSQISPLPVSTYRPETG